MTKPDGRSRPHKPGCRCPRCDVNTRAKGVAGAPLSASEATVVYTIKLPKSLKDACRDAGSARVRDVLQKEFGDNA